MSLEQVKLTKFVLKFDQNSTGKILAVLFCILNYGLNDDITGRRSKNSPIWSVFKQSVLKKFILFECSGLFTHPSTTQTLK